MTFCSDIFWSQNAIIRSLGSALLDKLRFSVPCLEKAVQHSFSIHLKRKSEIQNIFHLKLKMSLSEYILCLDTMQAQWNCLNTFVQSKYACGRALSLSSSLLDLSSHYLFSPAKSFLQLHSAGKSSSLQVSGTFILLLYLSIVFGRFCEKDT